MPLERRAKREQAQRVFLRISTSMIHLTAKHPYRVEGHQAVLAFVIGICGPRKLGWPEQ